jgi:MFS family permease
MDRTGDTIKSKSKSQQLLAIFALIVAGEAIFILPFILVRVFRPTILAVFNINNLELGIVFSVYGVIAMISYFFGGPLADKFPAKKLMAVALFATAIGGIVLTNIPKLTELKILYGFWGATTIFLFWAALIRATREWGGSTKPGIAFGLLDGGRGLTSAVISSLAVAIFAFFLPDNVASSTLEQKTIAYRNVVLFISVFLFLVAILVYFALPNSKLKDQHSTNSFITTKGLVKIIRMPVVWLQAIIILCAYVVSHRKHNRPINSITSGQVNV